MLDLMLLEPAVYRALVPAGLVIGHVGVAAKIVPQVSVLDSMSRVLAHLWALALLAGWSLRFKVAGHLPLFGTYESALSLALATMLVAVVWEHAGKRAVALTPLAALTAAGLLSHGRRFDSTVYALTISERSWLVEVHAVVAWLAFGVLALSSFVALRLILGRGSKPPQLSSWLDRSLELGFLLHTGMLATGSIYKFMLFGSAWTFDPIETLGLVVWFAYGTLLHLRKLAGWNSDRLARWSLFVFALLVISYRAIVYFPPWSSYHILDMDRRVHVGAGELGL